MINNLLQKMELIIRQQKKIMIKKIKILILNIRIKVTINLLIIQINQMMKVIGEEGTSAEDYIVYQKGELLDAVYLQQNSFDPIDAACEPERQAHEFNVLYDVLTRDYALSDKKEIRAFFNQVRQEFLDWHGTVYGTPEFAAQETKLTDLYRSKVTG